MEHAQLFAKGSLPRRISKRRMSVDQDGRWSRRSSRETTYLLWGSLKP
jgi:hypothetical protein